MGRDTLLVVYKISCSLVFILFLLSFVGLNAQSTIWAEDFNSYPNGTITGSGTGTSPVNWNSQAGAAVSGGLILASNTRNVASSTLANPLIWVTDPININGSTNVTFSLDVGAFNVANFEDGGGSQDNFTLEYRINGGAGSWVTVVSASGSAAQPINPSYIISGLSGSTLEIRAKFHNTAANENYTIDNVLVQGTGASLPPGIVNKQLYLSDPAQALDRIDPVATADLTTVSSPILTISSTVNTDLIAIKDTGIKKKKDDKNYGTCDEIVIDRETTDIQRALFEFDLSSIPSGSIILSAELRLNCTDGADMDVSVFQIGNSDAWDEGTFCDDDGASNWTQRTATSNWSALGAIGPGSDDGTPLSTINVDSEGIQTWPLTCLVSEWVSGASVNNGIALGVYQASGGMGNREATYDSRETTTGTPPTLNVTYISGGISFNQSPSFCSPFTIKAGQPITITNYVSVASGSMPANPNVTAVLRTSCSNTISTLTNPSYNTASGLMTWTGTLGADSTIPAGEAINLFVSSAEVGVGFSIDYDSQTKPSKIELPTSTYIDIISNNIYDAPYPGGNIITNAYPGNLVYNRVVVTDPFGSYDITDVNIAIPPPGNTISATEVANTACTKTYEYIWDTTGFAGSYNIETTSKEGYENTVTDVENLNFTISFDSDGDGISDQIDLDDDNDGIPDFEELNTVASNSQPPCGGETVLDFSTPPTLESGTPLSQGAVYRFPNITAGTDALVTIVELFNATVPNIDNNSADPASFKPQTAFNLPNIGDQAYVRYKFNFVTSGGSTPVIINKFFMNFNDIDGGANYGEQNWADNPSTYTTSNPTELNMNTNGSWVIGTAGPNDYPGAGNTFPQVNFSVNYNSKSEMSIRVGAVARVPGASAGGRQHAIEFACITNYVNPVTYGIDKDSDGIANHLDLDADNDGIYDVVEAGHNQPHVNGVVVSAFGANGLADIVETAAESGTLNYAITDTDGTPPPNYLDTDSDDDGCSDANEAYADPNADGGDNEYFGLGVPPAVDSKGRVTAAAYFVPADSGSNGTQDYVEVLAATITTQPVDETTCLGCNTSFSVVATNADSYQWQIFNGSIWIDLTDTGIYSGTSTNTLNITNATMTENGNQYRVAISNLNYVCSPTISNISTLTVNVNSVITNRRITHRANQN
ncbi:DNRLRE domain-containing protein [uncultured Eudoraea sp.]|uniref:DNRLRE domain-containing protein n=1 Tax=uncultured Eudoraea sp. TaxID=1035614 RepID=UPI002601D5B7|nr:DNRLRE domain-containing protein [uncultured Eudoraea sp.]